MTQTPETSSSERGIPRKVAVVTGASQGIGAALLDGYRRRGWAAVGTSRSIPETTSDDLVTVAGDVADARTAQAVIDAALHHFGRVDTLVNNAGVFIGKPFTEYSAADLDTLVSTNLTGFVAMTQAVLPLMLEQATGHVVTMSTGLVDNPDGANPSTLALMTKGGLVAATRSLAVEYADRGIRVNAVSPGVVDTPMHDGEDDATLGAMQPMGRVGTVADVVAAVLYLEDAPFVTGEILHVDGGMSAGHR